MRFKRVCFVLQINGYHLVWVMKFYSSYIYIYIILLSEDAYLNIEVKKTLNIVLKNRDSNMFFNWTL